MFNWFRRKFNDKAEKPEESKPVPETEAKTETSEAEEKPDSSSSQENYLNWAKAAYQNIQQRKGQETAPVTETEVAETETAEIEEPAEEIVASTPTDLEETTATTAETEKSEDLAAETADLAPEMVAGTLPVESAAYRELSQPEETTVSEVEETTEDSISATPAWMRKTDGLEKLKETALETPVEETVGVEFDDDFVWSAKVLADQGRNPDEISVSEINWLSKLRQGLGKTRRSLINQLKAVVGQGPLNEDAVMEIEALLLQADVGIEATDYIINTLQDKLREEALPPEQAIAYLKTILQAILDRPLQGQTDKEFVPEKDTLNVWLLTGVNGAGKTTTIGKLAHMAKESGYSCIIAAADTFRAAAVEQVKVWGDRSNTTVIANPGKNTDPAAVVFDGIVAAQTRQAELLLVDTAGRLQNKKNLMAELAKIRKIIDRKAPEAQVESLLVLDATLGQNGLRQAQVFSEAAQLSGVVLTKLDGTAKGGVALAVAQQLNLPIRFIGAGEGIEDLRPFSSYEFVEALLNG